MQTWFCAEAIERNRVGSPRAYLSAIITFVPALCVMAQLGESKWRAAVFQDHELLSSALYVH